MLFFDELDSIAKARGGNVGDGGWCLVIETKKKSTLKVFVGDVGAQFLILSQLRFLGISYSSCTF